MTDRTRLEQLEGVMVDFGLKQDRMLAEQEKLQIGQKMMLRVLDHHSDQISFLLRKQNGMAEDIGGIKGDVAGLKGDVSGLKSDVAGLKGDVAVIKADLAALNAAIMPKLDRILTLLNDKK